MGVKCDAMQRADLNMNHATMQTTTITDDSAMNMKKALL